jgi:hypothetical protein
MHKYGAVDGNNNKIVNANASGQIQGNLADLASKFGDAFTAFNNQIIVLNNYFGNLMFKASAKLGSKFTASDFAKSQGPVRGSVSTFMANFRPLRTWP